jgi:hypothetical protein
MPIYFLPFLRVFPMLYLLHISTISFTDLLLYGQQNCVVYLRSIVAYYRYAVLLKHVVLKPTLHVNVTMICVSSPSCTAAADHVNSLVHLVGMCMNSNVTPSHVLSYHIQANESLELPPRLQSLPLHFLVQYFSVCCNIRVSDSNLRDFRLPHRCV